MLTNNGGVTEKERIDKFNQRFGTNFTNKQIVMCHTAFGEEEFVSCYKGKTVLITAPNEKIAEKMANAYGYREAGVNWMTF